LPLTSIQKVFDIVSQTGGDWERALKANIARRHVNPVPEEHPAARHQEIARFRREERDRICDVINEAFGDDSIEA
jgi:hypothetical protein